MKNDSVPTHQLDRKLPLSELNFDDQLMIFDGLNIIDLINLVTADESLLSAAGYAFRRKLKNKLIRILKSTPKDEERVLRVYPESIIIYNDDVAVSAIEYFGGFIFDLEIEYVYGRNDQAKRIVSLANKHCENLVKFTLIAFTGDILDDVKIPFYNVLKLDINIFREFEKIGNSIFDINQMFPSIQHLNMKHIKLENYEILNINIPHLKSLSFEFDYKRVDLIHFKGLIVKNPQIRHLRVFEVSLSFVDFLNQVLPNLETLEIEILKSDMITDNIYLKNVKTFKINRMDPDIFELGKIIFDPNILEELECDIQWNYQCELILRINPNIKKFSISTDVNIVDEKISLISEITPNLVEASFTGGYGVAVGTIVQFLTAHEHLNRLHLYVKQKNVLMREMEQLKNRITDQWTMRVEKSKLKTMSFYGEEKQILDLCTFVKGNIKEVAEISKS